MTVPPAAERTGLSGAADAAFIPQERGADVWPDMASGWETGKSGDEKRPFPGEGSGLEILPEGCLLAEVGGHAFVGRGHGRISLVPAEGADFPVQFEVLEGVNHADGFINGAAQREVIDELVADDAVFVNQEEAAVCLLYTSPSPRD